MPTEKMLFGPCNFGYGRGVCPHYPLEGAADAVRFFGSAADLQYVLEREYSPIGHGPIAGLNDVLARQAAAYSSCLTK